MLTGVGEIPTAWTFALNTESTCDWEGEEWKVPVDAVIVGVRLIFTLLLPKCEHAHRRHALAKTPGDCSNKQGNLVVMVGALLLAACSGPSAPEPDAKQSATGTEIVQLGGPATGAAR